ncbi:MAG: YggS family pyridoxal phosphate-dependent enzyme [Rikenellaceae bacterium]
MSVVENYNKILSTIPQGVNLCAISKFHPREAIEELYRVGHRCFGESRPQEFWGKASVLPIDIEWHFIGHLQTNKVKMVVPYASIIESVDSVRLLQAISKEAAAVGKTQRILLQMHIAQEEHKQGFSEEEVRQILADSYPNVEIVGLMGMATYTDDREQIAFEFQKIATLFAEYGNLSVLSIGMSGDYGIAIECGATSVRIGSAIFGSRY